MRHRFSWTGSMPCTGAYQCSLCNKTTNAHPLDYSSVDYSEQCPATPFVLTSEQIQELAKENHYVNNLICLKQIWGVNKTLGVVLDSNKMFDVRTVADLVKIGWCSERFAIIDQFIGELKDIYDVPLRLRDQAKIDQQVRNQVLAGIDR